MSEPTIAAKRSALVLSTSQFGAHGGHGPSCPACNDMARVIDREAGLPELIAALRDLTDFTEENFRRAMGFTPASKLADEVRKHSLLAPARLALAKAAGK